MYVTKIEVDLSGACTPAVVYAKQGDANARRVDIGLLDHGTLYAITDGVTARVWVKKPDGTAVWNDASVSDNRVIVDLTSQMLAAAGDALAEIALYSGDEQILSCSVFTLRVEKNVRSEQAVESDNEFGALDTLVQQAETSIPAANQAAEKASQAATDANQAATAASSAASAANQAAGTANQAAEEASQAATGANQAATAASSAAEAANTAAGGEISSKIISFAESEIRENIQSGETTAEIAGKIQKWLSDLEVYLSGVTGPVQERIYVSENVLYVPGEAE